MDHNGDFECFFRDVEPRLRRAFASTHGVDGAADATAEALAWAWERWGLVQTMENPAGYLYRVGQSKSRARRTPSLPPPESPAAQAAVSTEPRSSSSCFATDSDRVRR